MANPRSHRPFSYERNAEDAPAQPSSDALQQAKKLREAAQAHQQRTGAVSQTPHEEFSYLETPIDDNTQSFSEAPQHIREAIEQARISSGTPRASILPPVRAETMSPPQDFHDARSIQIPTPQPRQQAAQLSPQAQTPTWSAHGYEAEAQHQYYTQGAYEGMHPVQEALPQAPQHYTQGAYGRAPPSEPHPSTYVQNHQQPRGLHGQQLEGVQGQQPYRMPSQGIPITLSPISPSSPQTINTTPAYSSSVSSPQTYNTPVTPQQPLPAQPGHKSPPPIPPQPESYHQPRGPVAMKSEEDLKTSHARQTPQPQYASNPKLAPYVPYGAAPATTTPFSPATVAQSSLSSPPDLSNSHQPGQVLHPNMASSDAHGGAWSSSLCSCAEPGTCFTGLFCPCILYSRTSYRLQQRRKKGDASDMLGHSSCDGNCLLFSFACGFQGILTFILGTRVRHAYEVKGDGTGGEFCKACCCCCCSLVQSDREFRARDEKRKGFAGPGAGTPYAKVHEMRYAPGGA